MGTNKKTAAGGNRQAGNICTFNTPYYTQIACKINVLRNLLALYDITIFAIFAVVLWKVLS
jgi:hypothetical protein